MVEMQRTQLYSKTEKSAIRKGTLQQEVMAPGGDAGNTAVRQGNQP